MGFISEEQGISTVEFKRILFAPTIKAHSPDSRTASLASLKKTFFFKPFQVVANFNRLIMIRFIDDEN